MLFALLVFISSILIISCSKKQNEIDEVSPNAASVNKAPTPHIYYATWDEFGRASKDCKGWGLCNFNDCWFCCTDEMENIVDCEFQSIIMNSALIIIDEESNSGSFIFKLNPKDSIQNVAIKEGLTFYIDDDIKSESFVLYKGEYLFNKHVGNYGGYIMKASKK